jgi:hypothetical protein
MTIALELEQLKKPTRAAFMRYVVLILKSKRGFLRVTGTKRRRKIDHHRYHQFTGK